MSKYALSVFTAVAVLLSMTAMSPAEAKTSPTDFIKTHTAQVVDILQRPDNDERSDILSKKVQEVIDFRKLASLSLGEHWEARSEGEKKVFLDLLEELLRANYSKKLKGETLDKDYEIKYVDERTKKNKAIVTTKIVWSETSKPVEYKLLRRDSGEWIIYDLVIDDVSLEETYRESYTKIIEKEGWDTLIKRMEEKVAALKKEGDKSEGAADKTAKATDQGE